MEPKAPDNHHYRKPAAWRNPALVRLARCTSKWLAPTTKKPNGSKSLRLSRWAREQAKWTH